jgi:hypothetical protein
MNKLEAQIIVENSGNYYEGEIDYVMDVYEDVCKHIGFKDTRSDKRYVVKFHDIFYYEPTSKRYRKRYEKIVDDYFESFCEDQYEWLEGECHEANIDIDRMLTRQTCGHYQAFVVDIPEITQENAVYVAMDIYDGLTYGDDSDHYASDYVRVVGMLQDMEDNYMEWWLDYIEGNEAIPQKALEEVRKQYLEHKERNK